MKMLKVNLDNQEVAWINPNTIVGVFVRNTQNQARVLLTSGTTLFLSETVDEIIRKIHELE